jgi:uncharacterized protein
MEDRYMPRLFDDVLSFALRSKGAVLVVGPKWCGKSTTCRKHATTIVDLMPISSRKNLIDFAKNAPVEFLNQGPKPMLIDEWQHISFIWDQIKEEVDEANAFGQFILTGSVSDKERMDDSVDRNRHTGNGRFTKKMMRTMSLYESGESKGNVSLKGLMNNEFTPCMSDMAIKDYAYAICRGGWPLSLNGDKEIALEQAFSYFEMLTCEDMFSLKDIPLKKDEQRAKHFLRSYARNISIASSDTTLKNDVRSFEDSFDSETFYKYMNVLRNLYVVEELEAWNPYLRSKTSIRTKSTRHFVDPSIATASLGLSPESLFKDMATFGLLFESLAVRDLRIYADALNAKVYKYRDSKKREADIVLQFRDGSWSLIEVKLGSDADIEEAANHLLDIATDIDTKKTGNFNFLMVITKDKFAYRREDGVYVVPLGCLRN